MRIEVVYSSWGADGADEPFAGGANGPDEPEGPNRRPELAAPSEALMRSIAGAESAHVVRVVECSKQERAVLDAFVQSQADGEAAYAEAQASGRWQWGNLTQFVLERERRIAAAAEDDPERAAWEAQVAHARERLAGMEEPT